jgi:microcystin-dependent protein
MAQPYVGEIRMFGGNFVIAGWAFCDGALLPISEYETLFNLIGTTYGGDGQSTFGLPDLRSRVPVHQGQGSGLSNYVLAQNGGLETVTLTSLQIPVHTHAPAASNTGSSDNPLGNFWANSVTGKPYSGPPPAVQMNPATISSTGGNQPHDNMIPFLCVTYIISLFGIYPSP